MTGISADIFFRQIRVFVLLPYPVIELKNNPAAGNASGPFGKIIGVLFVATTTALRTAVYWCSCFGSISTASPPVIALILFLRLSTWAGLVGLSCFSYELSPASGAVESRHIAAGSVVFARQHSSDVR